MLYRIGNFELDRSRAELRCAQGGCVPLGTKPFDLLCYLVEHRDRVVARSELLDAIWPDVMVSDASLSTAVLQVRKALRERASGGAMIRTVARRGYRFVGPVHPLDAGAAAEPASHTPPHAAAKAHEDAAERPELVVGRDEELRAIDAFLRELSCGRGGALVLRGEAGLGKSLLLRHAAARAAAQGIDVLQVRCQPLPGAPALWPFIQLLRQLARRTSGRPTNTREGGGGELTDLLRRLGIDYGPGGDEQDAAGARFRLFDAVVQALATAAHEQPLLVAFDDLHWADASSCELVGFALCQLETLPLSIFATLREATSSPAAVAGARALMLRPLDEGDARSLIQAVAGRRLGERCSQVILKNARGNPLMLRELTRAAVDALPRGALEPEEGWERCLPGSVRDLVARRMEPLPPACRELLLVAACAGDEFSATRVHALLDDRSANLATMLREAVATGLIRACARSASRYQFDHSLIRSAIYESCSAPLRAKFHSRLAQQIEREAGEAEAAAGQLVHHYQAADVRPKVQHYARVAAAGASSIGAHETAAQHLRLAQAPAVLATVDGSERVELLLRSAAARAATGADEDELRGLHRHAFGLASELRSPELMARAALGFSGVRLFNGTAVGPWPPWSEELKLLEQAMRAQVDDSIWSVLAQARLAAALSCTDRLDEADRLSREAVLRAERLGDPRTLCEALLHRARALGGPGSSGQRMATAEEALVLARRAGLASLERDAEFERAAARLVGGELTALELDQLAHTHEPTGPSEKLRRTLIAITRAHMRGEVEEAERQTERARELAGWAHPIAAQQVLRTAQWELSRMRGKRDALRQLNAFEAWKHTPSRWMAYPWLFALLEREQWRMARAAYSFCKQTVDALPRNRYWYASLGILLWGAHIFDDGLGARKIYDLLRPFADENVASDMLTFHGPVAHYLGVAALICDEYALAEHHFDDAVARCQQLGAIVPCLLTRKYRALMQVERGDRTAGLAALRELRAALADRELTGLTRDLDADLARLR